MYIVWQLLLDQGDGRAYDRIRVVPSDKEEILAAFCQVNRLSGIDFVGIDYYIALGGLAEDVGQLYHIKAAGLDNIPQYIPRPHAGELVHIPHQDKPGAHVYCPQQGMHKADIHHGHFIYNDDIGIQRIFFISVKMHSHALGSLSRPWRAGDHRAVIAGHSHRDQFQHAVDGPGLISCCLRHPLGRPARGRCQKYFHSLDLKVPDDCIDGGCLTGTGASGDN